MTAIKEKNDLKAQFFAEQFVGDYGTHVVNKATAAAEIEQQYFIEKIEKFKGEAHMDKIAVGVSAETF
uniref:Uncharacterized protein n=1 Tax=Panagrolaimus davidi TaxID=227884 RepID=A0A914P4Z6_9BILA